MYTLYRCSICGYTDKEKTNFCENCGSMNKFVKKDYANEPILGRCDCGRTGYHTKRGGTIICSRCGRDTVKRITKERYDIAMDGIGERLRNDDYYFNKFKIQQERDKQKKIESGIPVIEELEIDTNANDGKEILKLMDRNEDTTKSVTALNLPKKLVRLLIENGFLTTLSLNYGREELMKVKGIGPEYLKMLDKYFRPYTEPEVEYIELITELEI